MVATYLLLLAMGVDKLHCALRALAWPCGLLRGLMALAGFFRALLDGDGLLLWLLPWLLSHVVSRPPSITGAHHTSLLLGRHKSQSLNYLQLRPPFDACGIRAATVFCLCRATCITGRREACGRGRHAAVGGECWLGILRGKGKQKGRNRLFYGSHGAGLPVLIVKWAYGDGPGRAYQGCQGDKNRPAFLRQPDRHGKIAGLISDC